MVRYTRFGANVIINDDDNTMEALTDVNDRLTEGISNGEIISWSGTEFGIATDVTVNEGYVAGKKSGVFGYLSGADITTTTLADTWYPITGSFVNDPMENFSYGTDHIKYDGIVSQCFEIDWHATLSNNTSNSTIHITVKHNETPLEDQRMGIFLKNANEMYSAGGTCVVELEQDDEIQLLVESDNLGDTLTFYHFTTTICEFFD